MSVACLGMWVWEMDMCIGIWHLQRPCSFLYTDIVHCVGSMSLRLSVCLSVYLSVQTSFLRYRSFLHCMGEIVGKLGDKIKEIDRQENRFLTCRPNVKPNLFISLGQFYQPLLQVFFFFYFYFASSLKHPIGYSLGIHGCDTMSYKLLELATYQALQLFQCLKSKCPLPLSLSPPPLYTLDNTIVIFRIQAGLISRSSCTDSHKV